MRSTSSAEDANLTSGLIVRTSIWARQAGFERVSSALQPECAGGTWKHCLESRSSWAVMAWWALHTTLFLHVDGVFLTSTVLADEARLAWQAFVNVQVCSHFALISSLGGVCLTGCTCLADAASRALVWYRSSNRAEVAFRTESHDYPVVLFRVSSAVLTRSTLLRRTRTCGTDLSFWAWMRVSVACTHWTVESLKAETTVLHGSRE